MEQEILTLILNRLDGIGQDIKGIKQEVAEVKQEVAEVKQEVAEVKQEQQKMKEQQKIMQIRLDEVYSIQRSMEENLRVTRAEQEKESYSLAELHGKVSTISEKVKEHDGVIEQIRAIQ